MQLWSCGTDLDYVNLAGRTSVAPGNSAEEMISFLVSSGVGTRTSGPCSVAGKGKWGMEGGKEVPSHPLYVVPKSTPTTSLFVSPDRETSRILSVTLRRLASEDGDCMLGKQTTICLFFLGCLFSESSVLRG